jgi:hypothetical protein
MFTYEVFDDFIPEYHQKCIEKALAQAGWSENENISSMPMNPQLPEGLSLSSSQSGFSYNVFSLDTNKNNDLLVGLCLPLVAKARDVLGEDVKIERIRAGMFSKGGGLHKPHVDYYVPHYTILYYVNDSDGDTYLFNEISKSTDLSEYPESFSFLERVSPRRGRAVIFNGLMYHSSSCPEYNSSRIAININLMPV